MKTLRQASIAFIFLLASAQTDALDLKLSIQPILPKSDVENTYEPLAKYLSQETGHNIQIHAHRNFLSYWADMRKKRHFDLVLDAAHFTDYRVKKDQYQILARVPDTVSFSIVTHEDHLIFDVDDLLRKKVACMISPSVGALRLQTFFPDPMRQPVSILANDARHAAQMVMDGRAFAAVIPTSLIPNYPEFNVVETLEPIPHVAFSASPTVPEEARISIQQALVSAQNSQAGQAMLSQINIPVFVETQNADYQGYSDMLKNVLGYALAQ